MNVVSIVVKQGEAVLNRSLSHETVCSTADRHAASSTPEIEAGSPSIALDGVERMIEPLRSQVRSQAGEIFFRCGPLQYFLINEAADSEWDSLIQEGFESGDCCASTVAEKVEPDRCIHKIHDQAAPIRNFLWS